MERNGEKHVRPDDNDEYRNRNGKKLTAVGIDSAEKLSETGSRQAFLKLKAAYPQVCLVHLYALEGAILNTEFNCLSETTKKELKEFSDFLKK